MDHRQQQHHHHHHHSPSKSHPPPSQHPHPHQHPPPQLPFSRNSAASPSYARSPFPPTSIPASAPSTYASHPATAASPTGHYPDHQRRPSSDIHHPYYPQSRPPPHSSYAPEPMREPAPSHSRHHSASSAGGPTPRNMPPPSSPQQQQPTHQQIGHYGAPPPPRAPSMGPGPSATYPPSARGPELPSLNTLHRPGSTSGGMSISSLLGGSGPSSAGPREPTPSSGHPAYAPPSGPPSASTPGPPYSTSVHASPRMQHAAEQASYSRRPHTPDHGRVYDSRDQRGSAAGSPTQYTPEVARYNTPQVYQARGPPVHEDRRDLAGRVSAATMPPRPSSQPRTYSGNGPPSRPSEMGREPPPPDAAYARREDGRPTPVDYDRDRQAPRLNPFEEQRRFASDREMREHRDRDAEYWERERREREKMQYEEHRAAIDRERADRERYEREREMDREYRERSNRERTTSDPNRHPQHQVEYGPQGPSRHQQHGRPERDLREPRDPRDGGPWAGQPRVPYDHAYPTQRPGDYPATTGAPYNPHPPAYSQPPDRYPPGGPPHPAGPPQAGPPAGPTAHPYESPDRQRYASVHPQPQPINPHGSQRPRPGEEGPQPPSAAYGGQPGGSFHEHRSRLGDEPPSSAGPPKGLLSVQEMNRKGRISPLPQAVQGAQPQAQTPAGEPGIKSEFGRMFSGIGSGVRGIGVSSPATPGAQLAYNPGAGRRENDVLPEAAANGSGADSAQKQATRKRKKAKDDEVKGEDESNGRSTPVGRNTKRPKNHTHHHHHHHHHAHQHAPERVPSPMQSASAPGKHIKSTTPIPPPHGPPRDLSIQPHKHATSKAAMSPTLIPKPQKRVLSQAVLDSVAHRPRKHLGDVIYSVSLKPGSLHSAQPKLGYASTPTPLPKDRVFGNENSTLTVKVPRVHLAPSAREEITARRAVWGTDIYTDDSDVVAACIHSGWIRGQWADDVDPKLLDLKKPASGRSKPKHAPPEQQLDLLTAKPASGPVTVPTDRDLHVTVLILPTLERYASMTRYGMESREWGETGADLQYASHDAVHDGVSFMIHSVRWVDGAAPQSRLRGKARRERIRQAMSEVSRSQILDVGGDKEILARTKLPAKASATVSSEAKEGKRLEADLEVDKENRRGPENPETDPSADSQIGQDKSTSEIKAKLEDQADKTTGKTVATEGSQSQV